MNCSSRFAHHSGTEVATPVRLLLGRLRLGTRPADWVPRPCRRPPGSLRLTLSLPTEAATPSAMMTFTCPAHEVGRQSGQAVDDPRQSGFSVATFWSSTKPAPLKPCRNASICVPPREGRPREKPDNRHRVLCPRRERPCRHRAPEQRDEIAARSLDHLVGAGEQRRRHGEAEHPAVGRLMTNSNLVACTTGKPAGFEPLRMRPAYTPA